MTRRQLLTMAFATLGLAPPAAVLTWKRALMPENAPDSAGPYAVVRSDQEWHETLAPKQYGVLRGHGTEYPGTSPLLREHRPGVFVCAGCGQQLFLSETKYESGSGWPSFFDALGGAVGTSEDRTLGMVRIEIHCRRCGGHLGHVFPDGPLPTGRRYCTNGAALTFKPRD